MKLAAPAIAVSLLLAACGGSSNGGTSGSTTSEQPAATHTGGSSAVVKTASTALGTILVDGQGMTLYHLGGEQNGKFICTSSCLSIWHPLTVSAGGAPSGEVGSLGTVRRPEGTVQVTYKGTPLYTFAQDQQPGETKGQGIKDVGTWSVITTTGAAAGSASGGSAGGGASTGSAPPASSSSEGGYGY